MVYSKRKVCVSSPLTYIALRSTAPRYMKVSQVRFDVVEGDVLRHKHIDSNDVSRVVRAGAVGDVTLTTVGTRGVDLDHLSWQRKFRGPWWL